MIVKILYFILSYYILSKLYFSNLLFFLDLFSSLLTFLVKFFIKKRIDVINYNLNLVLPNLTLKKRKKIINQFIKLSIMNFLLALHQRFIFNCQLINNFYDDINIPKEFYQDVKEKKVVIALSHFGLYYDFVGFHYISKCSLACMYKMSNKWIENIIYKSPNYGSNILPIKNNKLWELMNTKNDVISIPCDQKANTTKKKIKFLNQETTFHYSAVDIHKITKRALWLYLTYYDEKLKKIKIQLIPISRHYDVKQSKIKLTQTLANILTDIIINNPEQYFWIHDRFNSGLL